MRLLALLLAPQTKARSMLPIKPSAWTRICAAAHQRAVMLWLLCLVLAATLTIRANYVADLSAFLPSKPSAEQAVLLDQLRSGVAARLVLIGIEGGTAQARGSASKELAKSLRSSGAFEMVHNGENSEFSAQPSAEFKAVGQFLFEHRYLLSPAVDAQRFTVQGLREGIDEATALLGTPAGGMIKLLIWRDPTAETLRMAENMLPTQTPHSEGGVWINAQATRAVLLATTRADGADLDAQESALQLVQSSFTPLAKQGLKLVVSGAGTFAVSSRTQIKAEVERLGAAGGVAIIALLMLAFGGSLRTLGVALLPVISGVLVGVAAVSLSFGNVHGITLGFGTTLIGEAVDYAIYYLIQADKLGQTNQVTGSAAQRWIKNNWPTVRLGVWTSICGFAALLFSGFPGLAQLGVFSIAGLVAAALTTRWVFPRIAAQGAPGMKFRSQLGRTVQWCAHVLPRLRWPLVVLTLLAGVALLQLPSAWQGDLASLSPISAEKIKLDAELRADLGASDAGTLIAVSATDEASVLALAEAAGVQLDKLVQTGALLGYESPARILPSPALQALRRSALPDTATLTARLAEATADGPLPAQRLGPFIADVQAARTQPLLTRASLQGTPLISALDAQLIAGKPLQPWRALLSLKTSSTSESGVDLQQLRSALASVPSAQVVNIKGELDALYARYLHEARLQSLLGAVAVVLVLALHLRSLSRLWRIVQPITAAVLIVLAALTASGVALGILHLVGLLLTVAIGSNYALFFDQIRNQLPDNATNHDDSQNQTDENSAYASLALANLTAAVSFGLLAFSGIPALKAMGLVVAPGILLCLMLSAAFIPARVSAYKQ
jgi:predicted exporter